jgi:hypothetical protein
LILKGGKRANQYYIFWNEKRTEKVLEKRQVSGQSNCGRVIYKRESRSSADIEEARSCSIEHATERKVARS